MADIVSPEVRSRMMAGIRGRDTKPELMLRKGLHDLPGKPDMVFPRHRAVLFAHGCFWHGHDCHLFRWPSTRQDWWREKINRNRAVDARSEAALAEAGWRFGVVWECALKGRARLPLLDVLEAYAAWLRSQEPRLEIRGQA
jgi:DNA mismatch endonuclease, patch repair protein